MATWPPVKTVWTALLCLLLSCCHRGATPLHSVSSNQALSEEAGGGPAAGGLHLGAAGRSARHGGGGLVRLTGGELVSGCQRHQLVGDDTVRPAGTAGGVTAAAPTR